MNETLRALFLILVLVAIVIGAALIVELSPPPGVVAPRDVVRETLDLLYAHESVSGKIVAGDGGAARGDYHIHREFWQDGCEFWKIDLPYLEDVYDKEKSEIVILGVWLRYCPTAVITGNKELLLRYFHTPGAPLREDTTAYVERVLGK